MAKTAAALYLLLTAIMVGVWLRQPVKQERMTASFLLSWTIGTPLLMALSAAAGMPVHLVGRTDLFLAPALLALLFLGIQALADRRLRRLTVTLAIAFTLPFHLTRALAANDSLKRHWDRDVVHAVAATITDNDYCLFVNHIYFSYAYYYPRQHLDRCLAFKAAVPPVADRSAGVERFLEEALQAQRRLLVFAPAAGSRQGYRYPADLAAVHERIQQMSRTKELRVTTAVSHHPYDWQGEAVTIEYRFSNGQ
jgi:hypothetical protein